MTGFSVPPGRAGRLRLRHSLSVATRGAEMLDQKLRVLRDERRRLAAAADTAGQVWRDRVAEAELWLLRGLALSGESALEAASGPERSDVAVSWPASVGIRLPRSDAVRVPAPSGDTAGPSNTALARAQEAYASALRAAAAHAAAEAAVRLIETEVLRTRLRVRALRRHWIPELTAQLSRLELALEQSEHEDAVRRRWTTGAQ